MYPWYERYTGEKVDLSADDKRGVQALYGMYVCIFMQNIFFLFLW